MAFFAGGVLMRRFVLFVFAAALLTIPNLVLAQSSAPARRGAVPGRVVTPPPPPPPPAPPPPGPPAPGVPNAPQTVTPPRTDDSPMQLVPQVDLRATSESPEVGLQLLNLMFNDLTRLYIRFTLPIDSGDEPAETDAGASTPAALTALPDDAARALLDPYGGALNLSGGLFKRLPWVTPDEDLAHGLFIDARAGLKLIGMPEQTDKAPSLAGAKLTPFYSGVFMLKFIHPLYKENSDDVAGGFEAGFGYVVNRVVDLSLSSAFEKKWLDATTHALRVDMAIDLPKLAAITISWNPWTKGSDVFGRNFAIGLKLLSPSPEVPRNR
jgi:hypothetical protein